PTPLMDEPPLVFNIMFKCPKTSLTPYSFSGRDCRCWCLRLEGWTFTTLFKLLSVHHTLTSTQELHSWSSKSSSLAQNDRHQPNSQKLTHQPHRHTHTNTHTHTHTHTPPHTPPHHTHTTPHHTPPPHTHHTTHTPHHTTHTP